MKAVKNIMKILLLSQFFSTTRGGGEYVFSLIAKHLADNGHKVWVITNQIIDEEYAQDQNIRIIFIPPSLEYKGSLPPRFSDNLRYSYNAVKKGLSIIKEEEIDIIHSNNFAPALAGSILSTLTGRPHITTIHDIFSLCGKEYWKSWGKQSNVSRLSVMLGPFIEKIILKLKHSAIHTVSEATHDDLLKFGSRKSVYVIPNTIEITKVKKSLVKPFQFVHVGRLVFYKNLEVVIKAIGIIKKTFPEIRLIIAGDGPHKQVLMELAEKLGLNENVKFVGYVTSEEKFELLASSNALVFPSLCEGFGLVILEAFSQARPVVVSNVRPLSDIVLNNVTGYVVDPYNENAWADAIMKLVKDPNNAQHMGNMGSNTLREKYNTDQIFRMILKMYGDFIK